MPDPGADPVRRTTFLYALCDPDTLRVCYVGKADHPGSRLKEHLAEAKAGAQSQKATWLRSLLERGQAPLLIVLTEVSRENWQELEKKWISLLRESNESLTNQGQGGEGGESGRSTVPPGAFHYVASTHPKETGAITMALLTGDWAEILAESTAEQVLSLAEGLRETPPGLTELAQRTRAGLLKAVTHARPELVERVTQLLSAAPQK